MMHRQLNRSFPLAACALCLLAGGARAGPDPDRKLIVFGYNTQEPSVIPGNMDLYEASPIQGMVIGVTIPRREQPTERPPTNRFDWLAWGVELDDADVAESIRLLRSRRASEHVTELFLRLNCTPGDTDWFDDEAWARRVANNWRLAGRIVREGRLRGIMFDTELYRHCTRLWSYQWAGQDGMHSWPECVDMAFERGRENMRALNREVADVDILVTLMHGWVAKSIGEPNPDHLIHHPYGLMPAYLDGMLSAKHERTRIYDGWEGAYRYKRREQFEQAVVSMREAARLSLVPMTYRKQLRTSFGIWTDDAKGQWDPSRPYYSAQQLEATLRDAFEFSDRYVWLYQERIHPWKEPKFPEGYWAAMREVMKPYANAPPTRPLASRPKSAPDAQAVNAGTKADLVAYWPLSESLDNKVAGGPSIEGRATFSTVGIGDDRALTDSGALSVRSGWPEGLPETCTISLVVFPMHESVSGLLIAARIGERLSLRLSATADPGGHRFRLMTGPDVHIASTAAYPRYAPYLLTLRFDRGRFDAMFVNDHQGFYEMSLSHAARWPGSVERAINLDSVMYPVGHLRVWDGLLSRNEIRNLARSLPDWRVRPSPGHVHIDMRSDQGNALVRDRWRIPVATDLHLSTNEPGLRPLGEHFQRLDGRDVIRFDPAARTVLSTGDEPPSAESKALDHAAYTIEFKPASMPPEGAAYGLIGRGDGSNGNTSFGVYFDGAGRVHAHVKSTSNFAKSFSSGPGHVEAGRWHRLAFALDRSDGRMTLELDGKEIASNPIAHDASSGQSLRHRDLPLRIGYVRVQADSFAPLYPAPEHCYFDGFVRDFRIERR